MRVRNKPDNYAEEFLFATDGQSVYRITNDGDNSEPTRLCASSLIVIREPERDGPREVVFTGQEFLDLCRQGLKFARQLKRSV
ncbi:MAG: hypothetical protein ABSE16_19735 [Verrucomicrobiota bacterium]|jgi:hypothetical protein